MIKLIIATIVVAVRICREIINFIDNNLGSCKPACKPDLLRVYFGRI